MEYVRALITEEWREQVASGKDEAYRIAGKHGDDLTGMVIRIFAWPDQPIAEDITTVDLWHTVRQSQQRALGRSGRLLPDLNKTRTFSNGVVTGYNSAQIFTRSGLNSYIISECAENHRGRPTIAAAWWHHPAVELLGWSAVNYKGRGHQGNVVLEIELSGVENVALWTPGLSFDRDITAIEDSVRAQGATTLEAALDDPTSLVQVLSINLCAAFNVQPDAASLAKLIS